MQQNTHHNTIHSIPSNHKDHLGAMGRAEDEISILIVEDDPLSMQFLAVHIEALEHKFFKAENGLQALDFLESPKNKIDIILMDREMPVMDGIKAVQKIKNNPCLRNIPIIMVTSADTTKEMREGLDAGVFYYLTNLSIRICCGRFWRQQQKKYSKTKHLNLNWISIAQAFT
jgi:CheY-like chemotaxis protein